MVWDEGEVVVGQFVGCPPLCSGELIEAGTGSGDGLDDGETDVEGLGGCEKSLLRFVGQFANHRKSCRNVANKKKNIEGAKMYSYWFHSFFLFLQGLDLRQVRKGNFTLPAFQPCLVREHVKYHVGPKNASDSVKGLPRGLLVDDTRIGKVFRVNT